MFNGIQDTLGAGRPDEDYGPPVPTNTQVAVQAARDVLTTGMDKTTVLYIGAGILAAYFLYHYIYPSEA